MTFKENLEENAQENRNLYVNNNNSNNNEFANYQPANCLICSFVPVDCVETVCCHTLFCQECASLIQGTCPSCTARWSSRTTQPNIPMRKLIEAYHQRNNSIRQRNVNVEQRQQQQQQEQVQAKKLDTLQRCKWEECQELVRRSAIIEHESTCKYAPSLCPNSELCGILLHKDRAAHLLTQCAHRSVDCENNCGQSFKLQAMAEHLKCCPLRQVECPAGCGEKIVFENIQHHQNVDCVKTIVDCEFVGCQHRAERGELSQHYVTQVAHHVGLLNTAIKQQQELQKQLILNQNPFARLCHLLNTCCSNNNNHNNNNNNVDVNNNNNNNMVFQNAKAKLKHQVSKTMDSVSLAFFFSYFVVATLLHSWFLLVIGGVALVKWYHKVQLPAFFSGEEKTIRTAADCFAIWTISLVMLRIVPRFMPLVLVAFLLYHKFGGHRFFQARRRPITY